MGLLKARERHGGPLSITFNPADPRGDGTPLILSVIQPAQHLADFTELSCNLYELAGEAMAHNRHRRRGKDRRDNGSDKDDGQ